MATKATLTQDKPVTYALLVIFTVDPHVDEHLQDQQAIRDEAESWLASLDATVHSVDVRQANFPRRAGGSLPADAVRID